MKDCKNEYTQDLIKKIYNILVLYQWYGVY